MTIEELERGMKLLFDQHVHFSDQMTKSEQRQDRTDQQIAELTQDLGRLTDTQSVTMRAITSMVASIGDLKDSQKQTDATVAALARRIDAFIAALGNGHKNPQ